MMVNFNLKALILTCRMDNFNLREVKALILIIIRVAAVIVNISIFPCRRLLLGDYDAGC